MEARELWTHDKFREFPGASKGFMIFFLIPHQVEPNIKNNHEGYTGNDDESI